MSISQKIKSYIELTKPRILVMQLVTVGIGFFLANLHFHRPWMVLVWLCLGTALVAGGAGTLNHYLEIDIDRLMKRTQNRPLPSGKLTPLSALLFGVGQSLLGVLILSWKVNFLTALLAILTLALYLGLYTPLKRKTWLNTFVGAVPGAIPPLGGWAAASGNLHMGGWILFFILFAWQLPHFYAIAVLYKEDYRAAGLKMLPVDDPGYQKTIRHILVHSGLLIYFSVLPTAIGLSGKIYLVGALILGVGFLAAGVSFARQKTLGEARTLLRASLLYLPLLLILIVVDSQIK